MVGCGCTIGVEVIGLSSSVSSSSSSLVCSSSSVALSLEAGGLTWGALGKLPSPPNLGTSCDPTNTGGDWSDVGDKGATRVRMYR